MAGGYGFANNYTVRGQAMRFLRDGYPDGTSQNGYWHTMYDVDRIEVLKGPGSALYGSGQAGCSVNILTKPSRKGFGAEIGVIGGSFGTWGAYADNLNLYKIPGYTIFDAAVFYRTKKWDASLNLKNLTDRTYFVSLTFAGALPGDPRSIMLSMRYR